MRFCVISSVAVVILASHFASACSDGSSCPPGSKRGKSGACVTNESLGADAGSGSGNPDGSGQDGDACVPDVEEICNRKDDDCDGQIDEGVTGQSYLDRDGDAFGAGEPVQGCPSKDYTAQGNDCDDNNETVYPLAPELCNGVDEDCDGQIDEGTRARLHLDADGDGHGSALDVGEDYCAGQSVPGRVPSNRDCDDTCATCSPDNTQELLCDGKDDDCTA